MYDSRPIAELLPLIEGALEAGGYFRLWPGGASMRPLLREGCDSVLLGSPATITRGDIVLLKSPEGRILLHRVYKIKKEGLLTRGDAHLDCEGYFPLSCVIARVLTLYRGERAYPAKSPRLFPLRLAGGLRRMKLRAARAVKRRK